MLTHKNITNSWIEYEVVGDRHKTVLVVETDLEMRSNHPDFDSPTFSGMVDDASRERQDAYFDSVRVIPKRN